MECFNCTNKITKEYNCNLCTEIFCSAFCTMNHFTSFHNQPSLQTKTPNLFVPRNPKPQKPFLSPYLTLGTYNDQIKYDTSLVMSSFNQATFQAKSIIWGSGTFGQVSLVKTKKTNKYYAIKHMNKDTLIKAIHSLDIIYNEIQIQSRLNHENIIKWYNVIESKNSFDMVLEYANCGSLFTHIQRKRGWNESNSFKFFTQICSAVYCLHSNNLIHRDIKPENIWIVDNDKIKLCDFGWCVELTTRNRSTYCGTMEYMAPEIVNQNSYDKSIDIWSWGILLYELLHGYSPFRAVKNKANKYEIINNIKENKLEFHRNISEECKEWIRNLWCSDVDKRMKIEDIFASKWFKKNEEIEFTAKENEIISKFTKNKSEFIGIGALGECFKEEHNVNGKSANEQKNQGDKVDIKEDGDIKNNRDEKVEQHISVHGNVSISIQKTKDLLTWKENFERQKLWNMQKAKEMFDSEVKIGNSKIHNRNITELDGSNLHPNVSFSIINTKTTTKPNHKKHNYSTSNIHVCNTHNNQNSSLTLYQRPKQDSFNTKWSTKKKSIWIEHLLTETNRNGKSDEEEQQQTNKIVKVVKVITKSKGKSFHAPVIIKNTPANTNKYTKETFMNNNNETTSNSIISNEKNFQNEPDETQRDVLIETILAPKYFANISKDGFRMHHKGLANAINDIRKNNNGKRRSNNDNKNNNIATEENEKRIQNKSVSNSNNFWGICSVLPRIIIFINN